MTDPAAPAPAPTSAAGAQKSSVFDDLVEIITSPRQVFARRERGGFGSPFIILTLLFGIVLFLSRPAFEPVMRAQMEKAQAQVAAQNPNLTDDQRAKATQIGETIGTVTIIIGAPIAMLILGLFVWVIGKVFGSPLNVGQGMLIATFSYVPRFLAALVLLGLSFVTDMSKVTTMAQLSISPARFLDPASIGLPLLTVISRIDVFVLWGTAVIAIGYATIGKMSKGTAYGAASVLWILGTAVAVMGALRAG